MVQRILRGYNWKSLIVLALFVVLSVTVGFVWNDLLSRNLRVVNWFLIAIWVVVVLLLCWDVRPSQDLALASVALLGGFGFEWWGTNTHLWTYFTAEKPPLWILPAWPLAALATARVAVAVEWVLARRDWKWNIVYWVSMVLFYAAMIHFLLPAVRMTSTRLGIGLMLLVIATGKAPRRDVALFLAGTLLGILFEYWGTSRRCWTYYTGQIAPTVTVFAHGFAQVLYARTLTFFDWPLKRLDLPWSVRAREVPGPDDPPG